jgi:glutamine synthetase
MDPFFKEPTISVIADIVDPITKENYSRDPRYVARKGEAFLKAPGLRIPVILVLNRSFSYSMR